MVHHSSLCNNGDLLSWCMGLVECFPILPDRNLQIVSQTQQQIDDATEFARQSPYPEPEALFEDMFADPISLE